MTIYSLDVLLFLFAIPLRGLEGVPGLPGAPQDEAGLTRKFETSHVGGAIKGGQEGVPVRQVP